MAQDLFGFIKSPEGQGLFGALAGYAANAQRGAPINSIGRGGLAGLLAYGHATGRQDELAQRAKQDEVRALQMEQMRLQTDAARRAAGQEQAIQTAAQQSFRTPDQAAAMSVGPTQDGGVVNFAPGFDTSAFLQRLQGIDPLKAADYQQKVRKDNAPITVAPGASLIDPTTMKPIFTAPKEQELPSDVRAYEYAKGQGYGGSFTQWQLDQKRAGASKTVVAPVFKQEGEEAKTVGKFFGENYAKVQEAGMNAQGAMNRYNRLGQLLEGVDTGKFSPLGLEAAKAAQSFGLKIDPNLSNKEAAVALSSEIALQLRNPSGGAGMPGAMSDADRNFLTGMVPGIEKTPEGRKTILETARKLAQRDIEVARMAREYRKKRGSIDEGFYDELSRFSEANPLFRSQQTQPSAAPAAAPKATMRFNPATGKLEPV